MGIMRWILGCFRQEKHKFTYCKAHRSKILLGERICAKDGSGDRLSAATLFVNNLETNKLSGVVYTCKVSRMCRMCKNRFRRAEGCPLYTKQRLAEAYLSEAERRSVVTYAAAGGAGVLAAAAMQKVHSLDEACVRERSAVRSVASPYDDDGLEDYTTLLLAAVGDEVVEDFLTDGNDEAGQEFLAPEDCGNTGNDWFGDGTDDGNDWEDSDDA